MSHKTDLRKTMTIATANRVYRADFQRAAILRKLGDRFTVHDLIEVMETVEYRSSWSPDSAPTEVTRMKANNYLRYLRNKGLVTFIGPRGRGYTGYWEKQHDQ